MPNLYLIMNHRLTEAQKEDAKRALGVQTLLEMPEELNQIWEQIPPDRREIKPVLAPIQAWLLLNGSAFDYVLIQGDFGACFLMVTFALEKALIPIYSTTSREAVENHKPDGSVELTHRFRHRMFRRYGL